MTQFSDYVVLQTKLDQALTASNVVAGTSTSTPVVVTSASELIGVYASTLTLSTAPISLTLRKTTTPTVAAGGTGVVTVGAAAAGVNCSVAAALGATTLVFAASDAAKFVPGTYVTGTGIAADTYVTAVNGTNVLLSKATTAAIPTTGNAITPNGLYCIPTNAYTGSILNNNIFGNLVTPGAAGVNLGLGRGATAQNLYVPSDGSAFPQPLGWAINQTPLLTFNPGDRLDVLAATVQSATVPGANVTLNFVLNNR